MPRPPLAVRGTCPDCGRVVTTQAPAGRATWRGDCPRKGCSGYVIARRIKAGSAEPGDPDEHDYRDAVEATSPAPAAPPSTRRKVPRATGYVVPKPPAQPDPDVRAADDDAGDPPAPERPADSGAGDPSPEPRQRERTGWRRRRQPTPEHGWRLTPYEHLY